MFTGIVEGMGSVVRLQRRGGAIRMEIRVSPEVAGALRTGDSLAVNGACITVTDIDGSTIAADLVPETLGRTNLGTLQPGEEVNLERPLAANGRLDGHIVQGHVDVVGLVRSRRRVGAQELLEVNIPFELTRYLAAKGSVAVDGVSLTVVDVNKDRFRVALIPHTISTTTLGKKIQGQSVNVEVDILSKYVERHIAARMPQRAPSIAALVAQHDIEQRAALQQAPPPPPSAAPRSQPAPRPAPPPRQQPPRFASTPPSPLPQPRTPRGVRPLAPAKTTAPAAKPKAPAKAAAPAATPKKKPQPPAKATRAKAVVKRDTARAAAPKKPAKTKATTKGKRR